MTIGASLSDCTISQVRKVYDPVAVDEPPIECPECARHGRVQLLRFHHISLHEAVQKCGAPRCMYPFRGFRYRDTSDAELRVYRYERLQPPESKSMDATTVAASSCSTANHKVHDDNEEAAPVLPDLSEDFGDNAVGQPAMEVAKSSCIESSNLAHDVDETVSVLPDLSDYSGDDDVGQPAMEVATSCSIEIHNRAHNAGDAVSELPDLSKNSGDNDVKQPAKTMAISIGMVPNNQAHDDEKSAAVLPDLSEFFDAVGQSGAAANHVVNVVRDAVPELPDLSTDYVDGRPLMDEHQFTISWLDELAEQAATESGVPLIDYAAYSNDTVATYDPDFGLTANDSFMDQLDIDDILEGICNSSQKFNEHLDDTAFLEQAIQELSGAVDDANGFLDVTAAKRIVLPPSPPQQLQPPKLSKCFDSMVLTKKPRRRRPKESGNLFGRRSAKPDGFSLNFLNSPKSDGEESVASMSSRHSTVSSVSTVRAASIAGSSSSTTTSPMKKLEDILAIKDKVKPLDLLSSLSKMDFSSLTVKKCAPALCKSQPKLLKTPAVMAAEPKPERKRIARTSKKQTDQFKINFLKSSENDMPTSDHSMTSEETNNDSSNSSSSKLLTITEAATATVPQAAPKLKRKRLAENTRNPGNQLEITFMESSNIEPTTMNNAANSAASGQLDYPSIGDVVTINASPKAPPTVEAVDVSVAAPAFCFVLKVLPNDGTGFAYDLTASTMSTVGEASNGWDLNALPMDTDANTVDTAAVLAVPQFSAVLEPTSTVIAAPAAAETIMEAALPPISAVVEQTPVVFAATLAAETIASTQRVCDSETDFLGFTRKDVMYSRGKVRILTRLLSKPTRN